MTGSVFDSSALLAMTFDEPGANIATRWLDDGLISAVNVAEVLGRYLDQGASDDQARRWFEDFGLDIRPFDRGLAFAAGLLRRQTREYGLSLGDRACLSLAMRERTPVVTADKAWGTLDLDVEIQLIR